MLITMSTKLTKACRILLLNWWYNLVQELAIIGIHALDFILWLIFTTKRWFWLFRMLPRPISHHIKILNHYIAILKFGLIHFRIDVDFSPLANFLLLLEQFPLQINTDALFKWMARFKACFRTRAMFFWSISKTAEGSAFNTTGFKVYSCLVHFTGIHSRSQILVFDLRSVPGRILFMFTLEDCFSGYDWESIFECSSEFCSLLDHGFDEGFVVVETVSIFPEWSHSCRLIWLHSFHEFLWVDVRWLVSLLLKFRSQSSN